MQQLLAIVVAIACIPVLLKLKLTLGPTLLLLGAGAGVLGGLSLTTVGKAFGDVFLMPSNLSSVLVVIEIGMLSTLMTHYGILKRMEEALRKVIPNAKLIVILLPAMIGALQAPGGAALSAPFVNRLGTEMGMTRAQRSNTNVVARHFLMLFAPFATNMVIVQSAVPGVNVLKLGLLNLGFALLDQGAGYCFLVRKTKSVPAEPVSGGERVKALGEFLLTFSPILIVILLNTILKIPFPLALIGSFFLVFLLGDKKEFLRWLGKSFNPNLAMMIVGVYFFQNIVGSMEELLALFGGLIGGESKVLFMVMVAVVGAMFGLATGLMYLPLGVMLPIVAASPHGSEMALLVDLFYVFIWCFIGYFFSPIHLCQLLSDQETGTTVGERYKTYLPLMVTMPILTVGLYFLYSLLI